MVADGCIEPLFPTSDISISSVYPFSVYAKGNEDGYSLSFCYTCDVMTAAGPIKFKMDNIKVTNFKKGDEPNVINITSPFLEDSKSKSYGTFKTIEELLKGFQNPEVPANGTSSS